MSSSLSEPHSLNLSEDQQTRMMEAKVRSNRMKLRQAICQNTDDLPLTDVLMASGSFLNQRYQILNFKDLISCNSQSFIELERLPVGLSILEKYGRHLLRPLHLRADQWRVIKYMNPIFAERVDTIQGGRHIIHLLGYTVDLGDGLSFPEEMEPNPDRLVHLVADIILAKRELERLIKGDHPNPQQLNQHLSQRCLFEISQLIQTGYGSLGSSSNTSATVMAPAPVIHFQKGQTPAKLSGGEFVQTLNSVDSCDICGKNEPEMICYICDSKQLCEQCDIKWHRHPQRQSHNRTRSRPQSSLSRQENHSANQGAGKMMLTVPVTNVTSSVASNPRLSTMLVAGLEVSGGDLRQISPRSSDDSFHSTVEASANNNYVSSLDNTAASGAVMAAIEQQQQQGASQLPDEELWEGFRGGSSAAGDFIPPPLPDVFRTNSYKSPQMEMKRQIAALDDRIEEKQKGLNGLLISLPSFADNPLYINVTLEKDQLLQKKLELLSRLNAMQVSNSGDEDDQISLPRSQFESTDSQPVFYPPFELTQKTHHPRESGGAVPKVKSSDNLYSNQVGSMFMTPSQSQTSNNNNAKGDYSTLPQFSTGSNNVRYQVQQHNPQQHPPFSHPVFVAPFENWSNSNMPIDSSHDRKINPLPPKTLQFDDLWKCEHCTTVNEPGTNICSVCYKTSDDPRFLMNSALINSVDNTTDPNICGSNCSFEESRSSHFDRIRLVYEEYDEITKQKKEAQQRDARLQEEKELEGLQNESNHTREFGLCAARAEAILNDDWPKSAESSAKQLESGETQKSSLVGNKLVTEADVAKSLETIRQEAATKQLYNDGKRLVSFLKQSDQHGYNFDEFDIAMTMCGDHDPIDWLKTKWEEMIDRVITNTTTKGSNQSQNCVGELSRAEARGQLRQTKGDIHQAVEACVKERTEKFEKVMSHGPFPREDTLELLNNHQGDIVAMVTELQRRQLLPYLDCVWMNPVDSRSDALVRAATNELTVNSVIDHVDFQEKVLDEGIDIERRIRMVFVEGKLQSWERAKAVIHILTTMREDDFNLNDVIEAVRSCADKASALHYLQQECQVCFCRYPMSKIMNFTFCQCKFCTECFIQHLELVIREKFVQNWTCPICQQPDIQENDEIAEEHFLFFDLLLRSLVDRVMVRREVCDLFQDKLRDWRLMKDPNFRWCAHCGNGFIFNYNGREMKMTCSYCNQFTCFKCKKQWESQHQGVSCEDFEKWKFDNNSENQAIGLARHLDENGIVCPCCKMRFALAKGGCMHFKCPQCGHEFCCGCNLPFRRAENCKKYESCRTKGLHCHHPRDCFFHLRDNSVEELQLLLQKYKVAFNTDPPEAQEDTKKCPVILQIEQSGGNTDEPCKKEVPPNHYGLCMFHYKEYLVGLINKKRIDPVFILTVEKIHVLLNRLEVNIPQLRNKENPNHYLNRLSQFVTEKIPLPKRDSTGNLEL